MSITLELPEELENELSAEAEQLGISLPEYALRVITTSLVVANKPRSGAEFVDYWQNEGLVGARPDVSDNQEHARQVRKRASRRRRA